MEELATDVWMIAMNHIHAHAHQRFQNPLIALHDPLVRTTYNTLLNDRNNIIFRKLLQILQEGYMHGSFFRQW